MRMAQDLSMSRVIQAGGWPPYCCQSRSRKMRRNCPPKGGNGGSRPQKATLLDMAQLLCHYVVTLILAKRAPGGKKPQLSVNSWFASKGRFSKSSKTRENVAFRSILRMVNGLIYRVAPKADGGELASPQRVSIGSRGGAVLASPPDTPEL